MNEHNSPEANRLNYEAQCLWLAGRNQEADALGYVFRYNTDTQKWVGTFLGETK